MSDILKKLQGQAPSKQKSKDIKEDSPLGYPFQAPPEKMLSSKESPIQIAKIIEELEPDKEKIRGVYNTGIHLAGKILSNIKENKPVALEKIKDLLEEIVNHLILKDKGLVSFFYEYSPENYLYSHLINVTLMSIEVGLGLGYNKSKLHELGLAAFLHDVGMTKLEDIYQQSRALSEEEYNKIKEHSLYGVEILSRIEEIPEAVINACRDLHERLNGQGYPKGLEGKEISEYARIIATVDTYEALTHDRSYRNKFPPHEAIKDMLTSGYLLYDHDVLKVLVNQVGIYPIGSWIELNTDEIGKVIVTNDDLVLRPVVNILFDKAKNRLKDPKVVNLAKQSNLYIKRPLSDKDIAEYIKEGID